MKFLTLCVTQRSNTVLTPVRQWNTLCTALFTEIVMMGEWLHVTGNLLNVSLTVHHELTILKIPT